MSFEVGSRIARNSLFNFLKILFTLPITLLVTPFIITHLGKEQFGVWALVGTISSYAALSDFGVTDSLIKFMAEFKARNDTKRLNQLINTSLTIYLFLSIFGCLLFTVLVPVIITRILSIPPSLQNEASYVLTLAIILFFLNMLMGVFGSMILGFQRMDYSNLIGLAQTLMMAGGTVIFVKNGYGLVGLVYNNALITLFVVLSNIYSARRLFPAMEINPFIHFNREVLKKIFTFSWKVQLTNITQLMVFQIDKIVLSHFVGLSAVTYYDLANRVATQAKNFVVTIFAPMVPAASELHAKMDQDKIAGLYIRSMKYLAAIAIPLLSLIATLSSPFVGTWIGAGYDITATTLTILCFTNLLLLFTGPGSLILSGIGKPAVGMRTSVIAGTCNLILCFIFVKTMGYFGILLGITTSIAISGSYFLFLVHKHIDNIDLALYASAIIRPLTITAVLSLTTIFLSRFISIQNYLTLSITSGIYLLIYILLLSRGRYFDDFDRALLNKMNPLIFLKEML